VRDAILVTELATLVQRLNDARRRYQPVLYFRYFTKQLEPVRRVANAEGALSAISEALSKLRWGGTDIEQALLASFEQIRQAKAADPELARAQIVLVTDGEAPLDLDKIAAARALLGELPIGVSIIALGQENPALRELARRQRDAGERVFYQFVSDAELQRIVSDDQPGAALHLPVELEGAEPTAELEGLIDEIEAHRRGLDSDLLARAGQDARALEDLGLTSKDACTDAEQAHFEAAARDAHALERRFQRWFGSPKDANDARQAHVATSDQADLDRLISLLQAVAEISEALGAEPLRRRAEAIELFERLLLEARLSPRRYAELRRRYPAQLWPALSAVRDATD
jgi:hypothetical protein